MRIGSPLSACMAAAVLVAAGSTRATVAARPAPRPALPDLVVDGATVDLVGEHAFDTVVVRNTGVLSVTQYAGVRGGGELTLRARRITVDATSRITADGAGWRGRLEGKGEGPGGGEGGDVAALGATVAPTAGDRPLHPTGSGAGGGYGGRGGDGILDSRRGEWRGGRPYGTAGGDAVELGSAGGAPPPSHHETRSIGGGDGGGVIRLIADEVVIAGRVSADGDPGGAATYDAAGGGSGGGIVVRADRLDVSGTISAMGGRGGEAYDVAGSGGGGRVKIAYRQGVLDPAHVRVGPGKGPCPGDKVSPWACGGTLDVVRAPVPAYVPLALRGACIVDARRAIALVMDVSSSMTLPTRAGRPAIAAAAEAAGTFLARMGAAERVAVVSFAGDAAVLQVLTEDHAAARAALGRLATGNGSRIDRGLEAGRVALSAAWPTERRVMVVVTDGAASSDLGTVRATAAAARAEGVTLYTVGIGAEVNQALLIELAGEASRHFLAPDAEDLAALYAAIAGREAGCRLP